jgi:hypothetical protein
MGQSGAPEPFYVEVHGYKNDESDEEYESHPEGVVSSLHLIVVGISPLALFKSSDVNIVSGKQQHPSWPVGQQNDEHAMPNTTDSIESRRVRWDSPKRPDSGVDVNDVVESSQSNRKTFRRQKDVYLWGQGTFYGNHKDYGKVKIDWNMEIEASMSFKSRLLYESSSWVPCIRKCSEWELVDYQVSLSEEYQDLRAGFIAKHTSRSKAMNVGKKTIATNIPIFGVGVNLYLIELKFGILGHLYAGGDFSFSSQFAVEYTRTFSRSGMRVYKNMNGQAQYSKGNWHSPTDLISWGGKVAGEVEMYLEARIDVGMMAGAFGGKAGIQFYVEFRLYMK